MQETGVQLLDQEDSLEKEMVTPSSILVWEIPQTEEPGGATVHGAAKNRTGLRDEYTLGGFLVQFYNFAYKDIYLFH